MRVKNIIAGPGGRSLFWHLWWALSSRMWAPVSLFSWCHYQFGLSFLKLFLFWSKSSFVLSSQSSLYSVLMNLLYGGYLYAAPHGSLVEIIPGGDLVS